MHPFPKSLFSASIMLFSCAACALDVEDLWRVNVNSDGDQAEDMLADAQFSVTVARISPNGRFVAFISEADNLVPDDSNAIPDAFVHVLATGETVRVSLTSDGAEVSGPAGMNGYDEAVVADNGDVAFISLSDELVPGDANGSADLFVRNMSGGPTAMLSVAMDGNGSMSALGSATAILWPDITSDGRFVTFTSSFSDLIADDTNETSDVFVRDRLLNSTSLVSVDTDGLSLGGRNSQITPDGRYVAFEYHGDVYVKDFATGDLWLESVDNDGQPLPAGSFGVVGSGSPSITDDGRFVAFSSGTWPTASAGSTAVLLRDRVLHETTLLMDNAHSPRISGDGRFVTASTEGCHPGQILVHDRNTGETAYVSVTPGGEVGNGDADRPSISRDGRLIAFRSWASNLVDGDTNSIPDEFVARIGDGIGRGSSIDQTDTDADGTIDACDRDDDNDGMYDDFENDFGLNPLDPTDAASDPDGDGLTNLEEADLDTNPTQIDTDGDTFIDSNDNCPVDINEDQADFDGDGIGDVCDFDDDNDGHYDVQDAYPLDPSRWMVGQAPQNPPDPTPTPQSSSSDSGGGGGGSFDFLSLVLLLLSVQLARGRLAIYSR